MSLIELRARFRHARGLSSLKAGATNPVPLHSSAGSESSEPSTAQPPPAPKDAATQKRRENVRVEHGDHDRHVGAADRRGHVHAERGGRDRANGERGRARRGRVGADEDAERAERRRAEPHVELVAPRERERLGLEEAALKAVQLAERDDRARRRDRADERREVDGGLVAGARGAHRFVWSPASYFHG